MVDERRTPDLLTLFLVCAKIGMVSFGGGLSGWLYREFVQKRHWNTEDEFLHGLAVSKMLPGPGAVNMLILMTHRIRGGSGVMASFIGFLIGPFFGAIALYAMFNRVPDERLAADVTLGLTAAALGLMLMICFKGVQRCASNIGSLGVIAALAILVGLLQWPMVPVVIAAVPISVFLVWLKS